MIRITFLICLWAMSAMTVRPAKYEYPNEVNFPCKDPTPIAFDSQSLLGDFNNGWLNTPVQPFQVMLHRCEGAGFCRDGNCSMATSQNVSFIFRIMGQPTDVVYALNHTSCACPSRPFNDLGK